MKKLEQIGEEWLRNSTRSWPAGAAFLAGGIVSIVLLMLFF